MAIADQHIVVDWDKDKDFDVIKNDVSGRSNGCDSVNSQDLEDSERMGKLFVFHF